MGINSEGNVESFYEKHDDDDLTFFEREPVERLVKEKQVAAFQHDGFWQCMDTQRDKERLEMVLANGKAPWVIWE